MKHWAVINKETGKLDSYTISDDDKHPRHHGGDTKKFRYVGLDREPTESDTFNGRRLVHSDEHREKLNRQAQFANMSRVEFFDYVMAQVDARQPPVQSDGQHNNRLSRKPS
jgi:hypothetical protein